MRFLKYALVAGACALASVTVATAATFDLYDHPDAAKTKSPTFPGPNDPVFYGLRLDGSYGENNRKSYWSFEDSDGNGLSNSLATMSIAGTTATISGNMRNNATGDLWEVSYVLTDIQSIAGVEPNDFLAFRTLADANGTGYIRNLAENKSFLLSGKAPNNDISRATFEFDDDGHRLSGDNSTFVGRGWVFIQDCDYSGANCTTNDPFYDPAQDFLFQAQVVPLPAAAWLMLGGIGALGAVRARRKAA